jgi:chromosome segregation protein
MFRLLKMEVVHWDYWQRFSVPLDASIVTIVGPNGSGKTTLLDALRTMLALKCSNKRDYKRYARKNDEENCWLRGVVDNARSDTGKHPFFPILDNKATLACRIEKRGGDWARQYCIVEGEMEIEQLKESAIWMGVEEYRRRLEGAGLTPAIAQVLSLEQGQTDKLCELTPRALLDLVFQVFGDKKVLDDYRDAREHENVTERELKEIDAQLDRLALQIERHTLEVARLREYQSLQQERVRLASEVKPRLEYLQLLDSIAGAHVQLVGARREWREKKQEQENLLAQLPKFESAITVAATELSRLDISVQTTTADLTRTNKTIGGIEQQLKERERLNRLAAEAGTQNTNEIQLRLGNAEKERAKVDSELIPVRRELKQTEEMLALLKSGQRADPPDVSAMRNALDGANIAHDLLPEIVEVQDDSWQAAIEAVLAPVKHIILLRRDADKARAYALGEQLRYRHFIVPERNDAPTPTPGSLLEIIHFRRPAPLWLLQTLDRTQRVEDAHAGAKLPSGQDWITRVGYLKERRGGRYAGSKPNDWHFGKARQTALQGTLAELTKFLDELEKLRAQLSKSIEEDRAILMRVDATRDLAARAEEFAQADADLLIKHEQAAEQGSTLANLLEQQRAANNTANNAHRVLEDAQRRLNTLAPEIHNLESIPARAEQINRIQRLRHDRAKLSLVWRDKKANDALRTRYESPAAVLREIERIERNIEIKQQEGIPDESVVALRDKLKEDHQHQSAEQQRRSLDNQRAHTITSNARERYIDVLRATVRNYSRNLKALGEIASVVVETQPPHFANDDVALNQAGLDVKFDFDRKGFMGMNDGDASGGQQVMKSLILLIALMMEDSRPGGFVFIDEPFAHLDIFNIDRVASFLRATKAQYLITTPITHNLNVYDPSMLTLVTFKKKPSNAWAPTIGKLLRQSNG